MSPEQTDTELLRETISKTFNRSALQGLINSLLRRQEDQRVQRKQDKQRQAGPCLSYTTVVKQYRCIICEATFSATYHVHKGETVQSIDPQGRVHILGISGKPGTLEIPCMVSRCKHCEEKIKGWERERLEKAFLFLLERLPFVEKADYAKAMSAHGGREVKL